MLVTCLMLSTYISISVQYDKERRANHSVKTCTSRSVLVNTCDDLLFSKDINT